MSVDQLDLRIIRSLDGAGRKPYRQIAEELSVSDSTVRKRINRMLENGIIKEFNVLLNYQALGRIIKAFIGLRVTPGKHKEIVEHLERNPDIQVLYRTTGDVDLFVEIICRDMEGLNDFLESELTLDGITGTHVTVVIGPYKRCPCTGI